MDADELTSEEETNEEVEQEQVEDASQETVEEKVEIPEIDPKDAVIGDYRRQAREQRADNETLRNQVAEQGRAIEELRQTTEPVEKSPIEKLAAEDPLATPDVGTLAAQSQWEARQRAVERKSTDEAATKQATVQSQQSRNTAIGEGQLVAAETFSAEKVGQGVDFESVITAGEKYLTEGEKLDIRNAPVDKVWELAYQTCKRAIMNSGTAEAKLLQQREAAHKKTGEEVKEEDKEEKEEKEVPKSEGEFAPISSFLFDGDNAE